MLDRRSLGALGVTSHQIAHRAATGRWQVIGPFVVVLGTGELSERQRQWAAVLHSGPGAALRGLSAATAGGLEGFASRVLHTVVSHGRYAVDLSAPALQVRVRQSRCLDPAALHPVALPPRQRLPVALVDAAADAVSPERARLLLMSGVQQRLIRPADLRATLDELLRVRNRGVQLEAVGDAEGGIHSLSEREWSRGIRRAGLPVPTHQRAVRRANGTWYLDASFDAWLVSVEVNGTQHAELTRSERDDHRRNVLGTAGRLVLAVSSHAVRHTDIPVLATAAALLARGWRPPVRVRDHLERQAAAAGFDLVTGDWVRAVSA